MTMTEQTPAPEKKAPAKKRRARANKKVAASPSPKASEMDGITVTDCPIACRAERCAISGRGICAHPHKGGLQAALQAPDTMRRYNEAKRILGKAKLDLMA